MCKLTVKIVWRPDSPSVGHFRLNSERGFIHALFIQNKAQIQQILGYLKHKRAKLEDVSRFTRTRRWLLWLLKSLYRWRHDRLQHKNTNESVWFGLQWWAQSKFWLLFCAQPCSLQGLYALPVPVLHFSPVQTFAMHINLMWDFNLLLGVSAWQHRDALRGWVTLEAVKRKAGTFWSPFSGWKQQTNKALLLWGFRSLNLFVHNFLSDKTSVNPLPPQAFYCTLENEKKKPSTPPFFFYHNIVVESWAGNPQFIVRNVTRCVWSSGSHLYFFFLPFCFFCAWNNWLKCNKWCKRSMHYKENVISFAVVCSNPAWKLDLIRVEKGFRSPPFFDINDIISGFFLAT